MNKPLIPKKTRDLLFVASIIAFVMITPPVSFTQALLFFVVAIIMSYDSWWSGIEAEREENDIEQ